MRYLLAIVPLVAVVTLSAQAPPTPQADATVLTFDVASVKRNAGGRGFRNLQMPAGRFIATGLPVKMLITLSYRLQADRIVGGPSWLDSELFDISAKAPDGAPQDQIMVMVQALLAERFKLVTHKDTRDSPIYELMKARDDGRLGPKLTRSTIDCAAIRAERAAAARARGPGQPPPAPFDPTQKPVCNMMMTGRAGAAGGGMMMSLKGSGMTLPNLAQMLRQFAGREIVDKTGLTGEFDVEMEFTPPNMPFAGVGPPPPGAGIPAAPLDEGTSLFTAMREQVGLKLESKRGPVEFLVIDSVERPTED